MDIILFAKSDYSHIKLEALALLLKDVEHIHVCGQQCKRWECMIECSLHVTAFSYPEYSSNLLDGSDLRCVSGFSLLSDVATQNIVCI